MAQQKNQDSLTLPQESRDLFDLNKKQKQKPKSTVITTIVQTDQWIIFMYLYSGMCHLDIVKICQKHPKFYRDKGFPRAS